MIHPLYEPENLHNDFAVVHLAEPFVFARHIGKACLPDFKAPKDSFVGKDCVVTGWGKDKFGKNPR